MCKYASAEERVAKKQKTRKQPSYLDLDRNFNLDFDLIDCPSFWFYGECLRTSMHDLHIVIVKAPS